MTDLQAAIGIQQLIKVHRFAKEEQKFLDRYKSELSNLPIILPPGPDLTTARAFHLFTIIVDISRTQINCDELINNFIKRKLLLEFIHHFTFACILLGLVRL
jgi:dTDP-4-amino-4,6-dideoxygalactose transaminase